MIKFIKMTGSKKILACFVALVLFFSSLWSYTSVAAENSTLTHKMKKIEGHKGYYGFFTSDFDWDAQYKVYFKYYCEKGSFGAASDASLRFVVRYNKNGMYQHRLTSTYANPTYAFEEMTDGEDGWSDVTLTFTPRNDTNNNHKMHFIGFESFTDTIAYISDFKIYKITDSGEEVWRDGFNGFETKTLKYNTVDYNVTITEQDYNEALFKDKMVNIKTKSATARDSYYGVHAYYTMSLANFSPNDFQFKAYYKYNVNKGNGLDFVNYKKGSSWWIKNSITDPAGGAKFDSITDGEEGFQDISATFTCFASPNGENHIGFRFTTESEVDIADFRLYIVDSEGNEKLVSIGLDSFVSRNPNTEVTVTKSDCNDAVFKDKMINIKTKTATAKDNYYGMNAYYTMSIPNYAPNNVQFKVYYKYRINKGINHNFVNYKKGTSWWVQDATYDPFGGQKFDMATDGEDGWYDRTATFTCPASPSGENHIGFMFSEETDVDVADFKLYVIDSEGNEKLVNVGFDFFESRNPNTEVTITKSDFDPELFKDNEMTKLEAVNGATFYKIFDHKDSTTYKNVQYKAYFKFRVEKGGFGTSENSTVSFRDLWQGSYSHSESHVWNPANSQAMLRDDGEDGISDITLTWTTKEDKKHYIGFRFKGDSIIYIGDFKLYVIEDGKERLIQIGLRDFTDNNTGVTSTHMNYEEDFFNDRMLHVTAQEKNRFTLRHVEFKEGEKYRLYMQYSVKEGMYGAGEDSNTIGVSAIMSGRYTHYSSHLLDGATAFTRGAGKEGISDLDYTFTINRTNRYYIGWWFRGAGEIYIYNFRLYQIVDGKEILVEFDFSNFAPGNWEDCSKTEGFVQTDYLPYDETLFVDNAIQLYNTDGNSGVFGTNVQLTGGKEYTFSFLSYYYDGTVRHNKINIVLREAMGSGKPRKVYYTTDQYNSDAEQFKVNKQSLSLNEYVFTAPSDGEYSLGIEMIDGMSAYFADFKLFDNSDKNVNLLTNGSFANNLSGWYSENKAAEIGSSFLYDGFLAQSFTCSALRYNDLFDKELKEDQMLYFHSSADMRRWLMIGYKGAKTGETYQVQFKIGGISTPLFCVAASGRGIPFNTSCSRVSLEWFDDYYIAVYEFTVPEKDENGNIINDSGGIKIGVMVQSNDTGCILDAKLWKKDDETQTNVLRNGDFKYGLADWGMYFEDSLSYIKSNELAPWYTENEAGSFLKVVDHDVSLYEMFIDDSRFNDGEWWSKLDVSSEKEVAGFGSIKGKLVDQNGTGLKGVKLVLSSDTKVFTAVTGEGGAFSFKKIPEDFYTLYMIDHTGKHRETGFSSGIYDKDIADVVITCDSSVEQIPEVKGPVGSVNGTVYTPDIKTVSNLPVYIGNFGTVVTDENGAFSFTDVPVGEYELYTVLKNNDKYVFRTVTVKENVDVGVKLKFDPPTADTNADKANGFNVLWVIIPICAVILLGGALTTFFIIKKKRSKV